MYFCNGFKVVQIVAFVSVSTWVYGIANLNVLSTVVSFT